MSAFGEFGSLCRNVPSFPPCNLYFHYLLNQSPPSSSKSTSVLPILFPSNSDITSSSLRTDAAVQLALRLASAGQLKGTCGVGRIGINGETGGIANIVAIGVSILIIPCIIYLISKRKAAVGRLEFGALFVLYFITLPLQLVATTGVIEAGSTAIAAVSAVLIGVTTTLFTALLLNGIVNLQLVEDGTMASLVPFFLCCLIFFVPTTFIALASTFSVSSAFLPDSNSVSSISELRNIALYVLYLIWPLVCIAFFFISTIFVVLAHLREPKPCFLFAGTLILFAGSQVVFFIASKPLCEKSNAKVDGSFIATILETATMILLFFSWKSITEDRWEDEEYNPGVRPGGIYSPYS